MAQNKITGTVKDSKGEPLVGVSVLEVGTQNGTMTDAQGNYSLTVGPKSHLRFSYVGFQTLQVSSDKAKHVILRDDDQSLNEVVVVGYGTMRRKDVTSSITSLKAEDLNQGVVSSPGELLEGKVPGLVVTSTGDPNGEPSLTLRGASTLREGAATGAGAMPSARRGDVCACRVTCVKAPARAHGRPKTASMYQSPSSSGQGRRPLRPETEIRILLGTPRHARPHAHAACGLFHGTGA